MSQTSSPLMAIFGLGFFYLLTLLIGLWASKRNKSADVSSSILASRNMPSLLGLFTLTATWVGGGYINGTAEAVSESGLLWAQAPWCYALALIIGGIFFAPIIHRQGHMTFLDPFEKQYGPKMTALLFIPSLIGELFWSAAILVALGSTVSTLFGLDMQVSIITSALIAVVYTLFGGLWSVAYTDVFQLILLAFGLFVSIPFVVKEIGPFQEILTQYQLKFKALALPFPTHHSLNATDHRTWWDTTFLLILGGIPWGVYFQRVLACRSARQARNLSLGAGFFCFLMAIPSIIFGLLSPSIDWSPYMSQAPDPSLILPTILRYLTPPMVQFLALGAISAAVMSSVDSSFLSLASLFTLNVYKPLIRPQASEKELSLVVKTGIAVFGCLALIVALNAGSIYALWYLCSDLVFVILFPQLVAVCFFKDKNLPTSFIGFSLALVLRLALGEASFGLPTLISQENVPFPLKTGVMLIHLGTLYLLPKLVNLSSDIKYKRTKHLTYLSLEKREVQGKSLTD